MRALSLRPSAVFRPAIVALGLLTTLLIVYPLATMVNRLFVRDGTLSFDAFGRALAQPELGSVLLNTVVFVGGGTVFALALGGVLAWLAERTDAGVGWASAIPLFPFLLPGLAGAIGWVFLLAPRAGFVNVFLRKVSGSAQDSGPIDIYSLPGMVFVLATVLVPYVYLTVSAALRNLDAHFEEASRICGASSPKTLWRVSLPLVFPALVAGVVLALMAGLANFSVPGIIGTSARVYVLSVYIYRAVNFNQRIDDAVVLSGIAVFIVQIALLLQFVAVRRRRHATVGGRGFRSGVQRLGWWRLPARLLFFGYVAVAAALPIGGLAVVSLQAFWTPQIDLQHLSFDNYDRVLQSTTFTSAIKNSLTLSVAGSVALMTLAAAFAYYFDRYGGLAARVFDAIASLPAAIPHIVIGLGFLLAFTRPPVVLYGTTTLLLLAYIAIHLPQALQSARSAFGQISSDLSDASRMSGAGEGRTFVKILLPLVLPSMISGALLVAVLMSHEVNASIMLAGAQTPVLGPTLFNFWEQSSFPVVAALSIVVVLLDALLAVVALRIGRIFVRTA
jgi:iron(III) transport system permease protein